MFGYVMPCKLELKVKDYEKFKAYYCGLCLSIKNNFGNIPRFALNYDMTFLAILLDSLNSNQLDFVFTKCIAHPAKKKAKIINCDALDYAAFCNISLTYFKLLDNVQDDNSNLNKILSIFLKKYIETNNELNKKVFDYIKKNLSLLNELETNESLCSIDEISHVFADLTAYIICEYVDDDKIKNNLYNLGYNLGRFIYLIDAYDDLKKDIDENKFNPINKCFNKDNLSYEELTPLIRDRIKFNLIMSAQSSYDSLNTLELCKNKELLTNILELGLMEKIESIKFKECNNNEKSI